MLRTGSTVRALLGRADAAPDAPTAPRLRPVPTGFDPLDAVLGGGLRAEDLCLLGGRPGVGKTVAALQVARQAASTGTPTAYASFEHGPATLLGRLLALELGTLARPDELPALERLRKVADEAAHGVRSARDLTVEPLGEEACARVAEYADRLWLVRASGATTDLARLHEVADRLGPGGLLVVDHLQKVQAPGGADADRLLRVAEGLKELAMAGQVVVLALATADDAGLSTRRVRLRHLRGSSALAHECDQAVVLNDKHVCVADARLAPPTARAASFRDYVVFTVEKSREGPAPVDLEFRKDFESYRFDPAGGFVTEQLVDDVLHPG